MKGKGEKERYTHLNAEFQRIARRDKKAFLSDQCKQIEENNRMGKPRDLFKKIRDTKGTFHAKMGSIKDRNCMGLTKAVLLPGKSHGRRSPVGCSPRGHWVRHEWVTSLSLFTFMHWRRKWKPTPVFLPGESQGRGSLVGCRLWGRTESDTTEVT